MMKPLLIVIAVGAGLGMLLPVGEGPMPASEQARETARPQHDEPRETLLERESNGHFYVDAEVNGEMVKFIVDTGASSVALTTEDAERLGLDFDPAEFEVVGRSATGPAMGQEVELDFIDIEGKRVTAVRGVVLAGLDMSLLGQSYLSRMGTVQMSGDYMSLR